MLRYRTGAAGSAAGAAAMGRHLMHETLSPGARERARYYAAERVPEQAQSGTVAEGP